MPEWWRNLPGPVDAESLVAALIEALTGEPAPPPLGFGDATDAGVVERTNGSVRQRETWAWMTTRDDEVLRCQEVRWEATVPAGRFAFTWANGAGSVVVVADEPALGRARDALLLAYGSSEDELDALAGLGRSAAFAWDVYGNRHTRLTHLRYTPMRLGYVASGDEPALLAALGRLAARPNLGVPATLATALVLALRGRYDEALATLDKTPASLDLALCRADVLSRAGRHDEAVATLPVVPAGDDQAHSAQALAVAVLWRAARLPEAAAAARALAALPSVGVWPVARAQALAAAALLSEDAGDPHAAGAALEALGADRRWLVAMAQRGLRRPNAWFLLDLDLARRVAALDRAREPPSG